ncbi:MAG: CheB methylesterase:MCP methyltransferase, CheR-type [Rhodospirillales bacterium]|nr:CheB methylesterase:MCP methyltransferase, CheR-type [Rhodospirillales bacterium]
MPQNRPPQTTAILRPDDDFAVVGIGASAGGLEACSKLLDSMPDGGPMAFILVQHLDPTHASMMVNLLACHTSLIVREATEGMPVAPGHLYVIPPGSYLSVAGGTLHLSLPTQRHGARLPFDFLLQSMAEEYGPRAVCIVLSGTGADGSTGLAAIKEKGGFVIAQDPDEAGHDGMPRAATATGAVDLVLSVTAIPAALLDLGTRPADGDAVIRPEAQTLLAEIIDLLRTKTPHDFTLYKTGTLQRRIERRMAMVAIETDRVDRYLALLYSDPVELDLLAKDLLINVTSFFRDQKVFELLAETTLPDLIKRHPADQSLRVWVAGCSTGEETYSLAMLLREQIAAAKRNIKLQIFASDVDPDAVAAAREGLYPEAIEADVSPERLARFFIREGRAYRVRPDLRASVVFTIQDVLADPPFARIDLVSCRNLLIYLRAEAQAKVIALFHFALREGGLLLLGASETVGNDHHGRFAVVSKPARLFRQIGRSRSGDLGFSLNGGEVVRIPARPGGGQAPSRQMALAELCRRLVTETYAPAAVLINQKLECLFSLGPTDRYLRMAPGQPSHDLLAMARPGARTKLRLAIQQADRENAPVIVVGGWTDQDGTPAAYRIEVKPVPYDGEKLQLICFIDQPKPERSPSPTTPQEASRVAELEQELESTRAELRMAVQNMELSSEEHTAVNEEALSVNEEYQSTNEELLTSKEELQSLNEELTALNSQLQETLERQRTTSNDLQNVLYSTNVATLFLDTDLNIRFFTPATRALFNVIASDIGRPLADLRSLASDSELPSDVREVLKSLAPTEREIETREGSWFLRRVLPYRAQDTGVEGVVITFTDVTERKQIAKALEEAKQEAERANAAKSRFLAAASHDLRQPLQTLSLLQGLLAKLVTGTRPQELVQRFDETLGAMSGMLNALLDINKIEAGTVRAEKTLVRVGEIFDRLRDEFAYPAQAKRLELRVVPCSLSIETDPHLLEQMIRNLLSNALKYTKTGKVLLGCRRHRDRLGIEIWDTGVGIPDNALQAIFEEYHQLDNPARERSRGLGLGLSIVQRLGALLGHRVRVRSTPGKGSVFSMEVALPAAQPQPAPAPLAPDQSRSEPVRGCAILVIEDDPEVRELLDIFLTDEGHATATAADGFAALDLVAQGRIAPDLVLSDYNLPGGMDGLHLIGSLREKLGHPVPAIVLTGDISSDTLREIARQGCVQLNKPMKLRELSQIIQRLMPRAAPAVAPAPVPAPLSDDASHDAPVIFVVDDDIGLRTAVREVLEEDGHRVETFGSGEAFLDAYRPGREACLLVDAALPGMSGLDLLHRLNQAGHQLPSIMITGNSDVPMAVEAMKAGASDFIEKPISHADLIACVARAVEQARDAGKVAAWQESAAGQLADLTPRQRQIMDMVLAGQPSKNIAADLGVSQRTVENHRASIMKKTGSKSLPALARLALAAVRDS